MNWLFLNPIKGDDWGGMENWMLKLCQGLPSHGDHCLVAARSRSRWPEYCERHGLSFEPFPFGFDLAPWAVGRLHRICRRFQPDIVVAKGFRSARFARFAWPSATIAVKLPSAYELKDGFFDRWTYDTCVDRVLVDNRAARAQFLRFPWVLPGRVVAVHNGVAYQDAATLPERRIQLRESFHLPPGTLVIGAVGRLAPDKRYADAVEAVANLPREIPLRLVLFGDGPERPLLTALAERRGVTDRVLFAGWHNDARNLLCACDVLVHPSGAEGLPNVVLEAMAGGVPVVATDAGGTREIIINKRLGRLVQIGDVAGLASGLHELLTVPALRAQIGADATRHVRADFSLERMVDTVRRALEHASWARQSQFLPPAATSAGGYWIGSPENTVGTTAEDWDRQEDAELISRSGKAVVHRVRVGTGTYYVKRFLGDRLFLRRMGVRPPVALLNFRAASRLALRGAAVVPHLAAGWGHGYKGESLLITGTVADAIPLDQWTREHVATPASQRGLAQAMATWLAHLHGAGVACHDLKASNILIHRRPEGVIEFILLDLDNCKLCSFGVTAHDAQRNLHQLFRSFQVSATPLAILRFLATYRARRGLGRQAIRRLATAVERRLHRRGTGFVELQAAHRAGQPT